LGIRHWREGFHGGHVLLEHLRLRHAHDGGRDRQRERIADQLLHRRLAIELFLPEDFHGDDAEVLLFRDGQGEFFETRRARAGIADARRIQRHLRAVKVVALESELQDRRVIVAGDADRARDLLLAKLVHRLEDAVRRLDPCQIVRAVEGVDMDKIQTVRLKPLQAAFDQLHRSVVGAVVRFRDQPDPGAMRFQHPPKSFFALAVAVAEGRVEIGHAEFESAVQHRVRLGLVFVGQKAASASEGQDRNLRARAAENAFGHRRSRRCGQAGGGRGFKKTAARETHADKSTRP
jgi:hypothetical protein